MAKVDYEAMLVDVLNNHNARMKEISQESLERAKTLMDDQIATIDKNSNLKGKMVEKALVNLGITDPTLRSDTLPGLV